MPLIPGFIEKVDDGDPAELLAEKTKSWKVKVRCWKGPDYRGSPTRRRVSIGSAAVGGHTSVRVCDAPVCGYVSGQHVPRAAAELLELLTGSEYWLGGLAEWSAPMNQFLVFEEGPSMSFNLQWATGGRQMKAL